MNHVYSETISCSCQHQLALMCICSSKNHQKTHFRCIYVYFLIKSIKHHQKSSKIIKNHQESSKIIKYIHFLVLFGFIYMFLYIFVYKYEKFTFLASILPRSCLEPRSCLDLASAVYASVLQKCNLMQKICNFIKYQSILS